MSLPEPKPNAWALVTGASSGIGVELARGLARRGHSVILVARRTDRLETLAAELREFGVEVRVESADLADAEARARLLATLAELDVSVLCNNAGLGSVGDVVSLDAGSELNQVAVNVTAVAELTYALLPRLVSRGSGAILMVGSTAGYQPMAGQATYAATKAFVNSFSQGLWQELRGTGVTCTLLAPGPIATEFNQVAGYGKNDSRIASISLTAADCAAAALEGMDRGRRVVVPGKLAKLAVASSSLSPTRLTLPIMQLAVAALH